MSVTGLSSFGMNGFFFRMFWSHLKVNWILGSMTVGGVVCFTSVIVSLSWFLGFCLGTPDHSQVKGPFAVTSCFPSLILRKDQRTSV